MPWHPLLFAAAIVLTAWFDAAVSPYAASRSLAIALLIAAALTGIGALVTRSSQLGGIAATVVIALLWSKQLIDAAGGPRRRAGPDHRSRLASRWSPRRGDGRVLAAASDV